MAASDILQIGADATITINLTDANGSALDLSTYEGYAVILQYVDGTEITKYSKEVVTGYNSDDIDTTNEATGVIVLNFQRALSVLGKPDAKVQHIIQVQSTDSDFASSQFRDLTAPTDTFRFGKQVIPTADVS